MWKDSIIDHIAYAGHGIGYDNPKMQNVKGIGPIPCGWYTIGALQNESGLGNDVMPLIPDAENDMFGRSGFWWHGDEIKNPGKHLASDGCIISHLYDRLHVAESGDNRLQVIP